VTEEMERVTALMPKSLLAELDQAATEDALSRSAMLRLIVVTYLRERQGPGDAASS
jgi:metal-responsive CopG/Arc/MetJ family transcriptional regulator